MWSIIKQILPLVEKPFRYIGGEVGIAGKNWDQAKVRICLAFPDVYELAMSNTGLPILYNIVNNHPDFLADRVYTPWPDMAFQLKQNKLPLFSLDHKRAVADFEVLGITLPYELSYTNVINILDLAGIPFYSKDRNESYPLIIGGGPCAFNPEPVAPFFDAIVLGDGEQTIIQILEIVKIVKTRREQLNQLSQIQGVYVSSLGQEQQVHKSTVDDLEAVSYPTHPVVPYAAAHNRAGIEVSRGCQRGCRFCQAGFVYRPLRHRSVATAVNLAKENLASTGQEDFSFLSLSLSDYPEFCNLLKATQEATKNQYVNPQFPSLRAESLSDETLDIIKKARSGSFTLAPEAGTERMRQIINKGNTDEDLYASVQKIFSSGWHRVKLYFMIGLPGENEEELAGIVKISKHCLAIGKKHNRRAEVTVSTSIFVPKAHTPFQWVSQISMAEAQAKIAYLQKQLKGRGLSYRWHNSQMSFLEGVLARGGQELAPVLVEAYKSGQYFSGWDEYFNLEKWQAALSQFGINPEQYLKARDQDAKLPWDHLYVDLKKKFLWQEYEKSLKGQTSPICSLSNCLGCGVCK
ncbi:MAG: TIGR03960 family B12-binding radical SAM protein [Pseudomonadota bacterium]